MMPFSHSPLFGKNSNPSLVLFLLVAIIVLYKSRVEGGETTRSTKAILFAGDSDIELWKNTNQLYLNSVNEGVGGTTCQQWTKRIDKWLTKYEPTIVVLVCGENDMAYGDSPSKTFKNFQKVVRKIADSGATTIYMGTKPEPATKNIHRQYRQYDAKIRKWGKKQDSFVMIDVNPSFLELGNPKTLYAKDRLHLSSEGYGYWNDWLGDALQDIPGCLRWKSGECTLVASPSCFDDPDFVYRVGNKNRGCNWVGRRAGRRCGRSYNEKELWEYCPESCGDC